MTWTLCTSGAITAKAGANVNSTLSASGALIAQIGDWAEGQFIALTRMDYITNYAGVQASIKNAVSDAVSDLGAMKLIVMDMSGYTNQLEAQTMLDYLRDDATRIISELKDLNIKKLNDPSNV